VLPIGQCAALAHGVGRTLVCEAFAGDDDQKTLHVRHRTICFSLLICLSSPGIRLRAGASQRFKG
jgi:hypothetical protein